jgi:hypothetical protein
MPACMPAGSACVDSRHAGGIWVSSTSLDTLDTSRCGDNFWCGDNLYVCSGLDGHNLTGQVACDRTASLGGSPEARECTHIGHSASVDENFPPPASQVLSSGDDRVAQARPPQKAALSASNDHSIMPPSFGVGAGAVGKQAHSIVTTAQNRTVAQVRRSAAQRVQPCKRRRLDPAVAAAVRNLNAAGLVQWHRQHWAMHLGCCMQQWLSLTYSTIALTLRRTCRPGTRRPCGPGSRQLLISLAAASGHALASRAWRWSDRRAAA